jgi:multiple sugar transport system substrate-binding protein
VTLAETQVVDLKKKERMERRGEMRLKKRVWVSLVVMLFVTSLCFAGGGQEAGKAKGPITLYAASHATAQTTATIELAEKYSRENPNVKVVVDAIPYDDWIKKTTIDITSGNPKYDIYFNAHNLTLGQKDAGLLYPLDEYLKKDKFEKVTGMSWEGWNWDDFAKGYVIECEWNGKMYGIPWRGDTQLLFYNKEYFRKAGLNPDRPPETMKEWYADAKALNMPEAGVYGAQYCMTQKTQAQQTFIFHLYSYGGKVHDENLKFTGNLNSPLAVKALTEMIGSFADMSPRAPQSHVFETAVEFCQGKVAMLTNWPFVGPMAYDPKQSVLKPDQVGYGLYPHAEGVEPVAIAYGWGAYMSAASKHKDEAFKFMAWVTAAEQEKVHASQGTPTRKSVMLDPTLAKLYPVWPILKEATDHYIQSPIDSYISNSLEIDDVVAKYLTMAYTGQMSPKAALDAAAKEADVLATKGVKRMITWK